MVKEVKQTSKKNVVSKKKNVETKAKKETSSKKETIKKVAKTTKKTGIFNKISNWVRSVIKEVSKVKWPSKKEMLKYSIATIAFVVFFALFFYAIELLMAFLKSLV